MRILFLVPYPEGEAPSQRFRLEQYFPVLREKGYEVTIKPFLSTETWKILYKEGNTLKKGWGIVKGFIGRIKTVSNLQQYDWIFIHREASPVGPPIFEWLIAKVWKKRIIYDFDDAIWLPNTSEQNRIAAKLKFHQKVGAICRWSHMISCGNQYLADYARSQAKRARVFVNPTTIDTLNLHKQLKEQDSSPVVVGWTGTHSTIKYLKPIEAVLQKLSDKYPQLIIRIISNQPPDLAVERLEYIPWNKEREIEDLLSFNIGLMPLTEDEWSAGKCGFKALQYMALGIPAVVSPVGVNSEIVEHEKTGFIARTEEEWLLYLDRLIANPELREEMGNKARQAVTERFSVGSNTSLFLGLFRE